MIPRKKSWYVWVPEHNLFDNTYLYLFSRFFCILQKKKCYNNAKDTQLENVLKSISIAAIHIKLTGTDSAKLKCNIKLSSSSIFV